jgi:hypothetical protein
MTSSSQLDLIFPAAFTFINISVVQRQCHETRQISLMIHELELRILSQVVRFN